jgi:phosphatidylglycerophosphate synthase
VRAVQRGPVTGLLALVALLAVLARVVGLGTAGWVVGLACGAGLTVTLSLALARHHRERLGPADRVTLTRAVLACGVAALTAASFTGTPPVAALVTLASVALVLDAVDGRVARRTGSSSAFGARFDMEVDAFLIAVLSIFVARSAGWWVLLIGAARYAFVAAGWALPWLRRPLPARYWCKVVAATQGIVLTVAAAGVLPSGATSIALAVALVLLAESFGRDVWWLRHHRDQDSLALDVPRGTRAEAATTLVTVLACLLVWFALVAPDQPGSFTPSGLVRIPLEGLLLVAVVILLPARTGRVVALLVGAALGVVAVVKVLDMGFEVALGRPFNAGIDWRYFGSAVGVLGDSIGRGGALVATVLVSLAAVAVLVLMPVAVLRLTRIAGRQRRTSLRAATSVAVVWALCAAAGAQLVPGAPIASASAAVLAYDQVDQGIAGIKDKQTFDQAASVDAFRDTSGTDLLTGLRGKDVIVAFVESFGRVAVQDSSFSPQVDAVLDAGTKQLQASGWSARSAFLTSPTFGGISWLAHSTLQSGLWIKSQQRYDELLASNRLTLSGAFKKAGWRTVDDVPSNEGDWSQGAAFYGYDQIYDQRNVGYAGPPFSYATMPDQYVLSAFQRLELTKPHAPVMAEIDLVSSHTPWAPLPRMVGWNAVGNGSVFDGMPEQGESPGVVWRDADHVRAAYGQSVVYSLTALISFVRTFHDDNLVLVVLGDHQPATVVSGPGASHDVPVAIIAHDPAVLAKVASWHWQDGLRPGRDAPVWPMDAFRDRFLTAYGPP